MNAGQAAGEPMSGVEKGGIAVRHLSGQSEELGGNRASGTRVLTRQVKLHGFLCPTSPVAQQPPHDGHALASVTGGNRVLAEQVPDDAIIIAGVNRYFCGAACL